MTSGYAGLLALSEPSGFLCEAFRNTHRPWAARRCASGDSWDPHLSSVPCRVGHCTEWKGCFLGLWLLLSSESPDPVSSVFTILVSMFSMPFPLMPHPQPAIPLLSQSRNPEEREDTHMLLVSLFLSLVFLPKSTRLKEAYIPFQLKLPFWIGSPLHKLDRLALEIIKGREQRI